MLKQILIRRKFDMADTEKIINNSNENTGEFTPLGRRLRKIVSDIRVDIDKEMDGIEEKLIEFANQNKSAVQFSDMRKYLPITSTRSTADTVVEWAKKNELTLSGTILDTGEWNFTISWE